VVGRGERAYVGSERCLERGLGEVEIRRGCDCLGRLTGRDVWKKISFPLEESAIV